MEDARAVVVLQRRALLHRNIQSLGGGWLEWVAVRVVGATDLFLLPQRSSVNIFNDRRVIFHVSEYKTPVSSERWVFPTFPGWFGLQQEITREHLRTRAFSQKITRAWHHSQSPVHAEERARRLPEELCFSWEKNTQPICRMDDFFGRKSRIQRLRLYKDSSQNL